jgi:hypothetical protein
LAKRVCLCLFFFFAIMQLFYHRCEHGSSYGCLSGPKAYSCIAPNMSMYDTRGYVNATTLSLLAGTLIAILIAIYCLWQVSVLKRRFSAALSNRDGDSIEQTLATHLKRVETVNTHLLQLDEAYKRLAASGSLASQKISIVRFNPFGDTGGDQSFVLGVLDAHNSGYVITSIHGREGTRVYVKPIDYGKSKYPLSEEEKQALAQAIKRVPATT